MGAGTAAVSMGTPSLAEKIGHRVLFVSLALLVACFGFGVVPLASDLILRVALVIGVLAMLAIAEFARREHWREIQPGYVAITNGMFVVDSPSTFREALQIPPSAIRAASIDGTQEAEQLLIGQGVAEEAPAFPIYGDEGTALDRRVRGYLTDRPSRWTFPLRLLGRSPGRPNAAIVFDRPVVTPDLRHEFVHGPQRKEALGGLAFWVTDPEALQRLVDAAGIRRVLREDDLARVDAIESGAIPAAEIDVRTREDAEARSLIKSAAVVLFFGLWLPPLAVATVPWIPVIWRNGMRPHAIAISLVAAFALAAQLGALVVGDLEAWRIAVGCVLTVVALPYAIFGPPRDAEPAGH